METRGNLELKWINKEFSIYYEINEEESIGINPIWVPKNDIRISEPRILQLRKRVGDPNSDNMLIKGDNLLALKTLTFIFQTLPEPERIKCVYIDPPFNTGNAFADYEDNLERSEWLTLMRDRLVLIKKLMRNDGLIFVHLDSRGVFHLKVLMDEIFGPQNFKNVISLTTNAPSGFKITGNKIFSTSNFILIYGKSSSSKLNQIFLPL